MMNQRWNSVVALLVGSAVFWGVPGIGWAQEDRPEVGPERNGPREGPPHRDVERPGGPRHDLRAESDRPRGAREAGRPGRRFDGPPRGPDGDRPQPFHPEGPDPNRPDMPHDGPFPMGGPFQRGPAADGLRMHQRDGGRPGLPMMRDFRQREMERMKQVDPEMYELETADRQLEQQSMMLSERFRNASVDEQKKLRAELEKVVGQHFEVRQKKRELQLKRLEAELDRLRTAIETRVKTRNAIVAKRIAELTGQDNPLDF